MNLNGLNLVNKSLSPEFIKIPLIFINQETLWSSSTHLSTNTCKLFATNQSSHFFNTAPTKLNALMPKHTATKVTQ